MDLMVRSQAAGSDCGTSEWSGRGGCGPDGANIAGARRRRGLSTLCHAVCVGAVIVGLADSARTAPLPQDARKTKPDPLISARKYLEGRWSLLSFDVFPPGRPPIHMGGEGTLTYDDFGNLRVEIRVDEAIVPLLEEAGIPTTRGVISTSGRTVVDLQAHTLTYFLEGQLPFGTPSGPLALNRQRHWQVDGNVLTLTTKGEDGQPLSVGRWQKMP
jgi:hypothetical protein